MTPGGWRERKKPSEVAAGEFRLTTWMLSSVSSEIGEEMLKESRHSQFWVTYGIECRRNILTAWRRSCTQWRILEWLCPDCKFEFRICDPHSEGSVHRISINSPRFSPLWTQGVLPECLQSKIWFRAFESSHTNFRAFTKSCTIFLWSTVLLCSYAM